MTNKEFEVMRNAQKQENNLAVLRELDSIKAEIKEKSITEFIIGGYTRRTLKERDVLEIIDKHIKEYEE